MFAKTFIDTIQKFSKDMELKETRRMTCQCSTSGTSRNLSVTKVGIDKLLYHCFKCGERGAIKPDGFYSSTGRRKSKFGSANIPSLATGDPDHWYLRLRDVFKDFTLEYPFSLQENGVMCKGMEVYWQTTDGYVTRNYDSEYKGPKWMKVGAAPLWVPSKLSQRLYLNIPRDPLLITEDVVSAMCLDYMGYDAVSTMGTTLKPEVAVWANKMGYSQAGVWYDDDNTDVRRKTTEARNLLSLQVSKVRSVSNPKDPKYLNTGEVIAALGGKFD